MHVSDSLRGSGELEMGLGEKKLYEKKEGKKGKILNQMRGVDSKRRFKPVGKYTTSSCTQTGGISRCLLGRDTWSPSFQLIIQSV